MASNLPPGVTKSMIPGNRPEDIRAEAMVDDIYEALGPIVHHRLSDREVDELIDRLWTVTETATTEGYKSGRLDQMREELSLVEDDNA